MDTYENLTQKNVLDIVGKLVLSQEACFSPSNSEKTDSVLISRFGFGFGRILNRSHTKCHDHKDSRCGPIFCNLATNDRPYICDKLTLKQQFFFRKR